MASKGRVSKNVYAYQLLGGGADTATAGLNFIPPLSCFFQNSVMIPDVNRIGNTTYTSDLMILTYASATITINGNSIPSTQAQPVLGNTDWVTYRIYNVSGNTTIESTGPLAAGVFGFIGTASGFAGYYSPRSYWCLAMGRRLLVSTCYPAGANHQRDPLA